MKVVILGATKGIGRALARQMSARGDHLHLLGRDLEELSRCGRDLGVRSPAAAPVSWSHCDLDDPNSFRPALDRAMQELGGLDAVVVTAGLFATQERLEQDHEFLRRLLTVNFGHTVLFCEEARKQLLLRGGGTLCVFSSVAGERGRKPVVLYGAAKAGLTRYLEGLDHKYRSQGLKTVCIKPGFVRTSMTAGLPEPPFAADADTVAAASLRAIDRGQPVAYVPAIWALVIAVIRLLPRGVMRRLSF